MAERLELVDRRGVVVTLVDRRIGVAVPLDESGVAQEGFFLGFLGPMGRAGGGGRSGGGGRFRVRGRRRRPHDILSGRTTSASAAAAGSKGRHHRRGRDDRADENRQYHQPNRSGHASLLRYRPPTAGHNPTLSAAFPVLTLSYRKCEREDRPWHGADVGLGSRLCENSEIEFANRNFVSTSINLKNKSAGDGCREKTIEKTILRTFRAQTFSRSQGQKRKSRPCGGMSALPR